MKVKAIRTQSSHCMRCGKKLTNPESMAAGMGPDCRALMALKAMGSDIEDESGSIYDLPFDPQTLDILCGRTSATAPLHFNIRQTSLSRSKSRGFDWGYSGSGPTAFALEVLYLFTKNERFARVYASEFREEFIARLPFEGGTISGLSILSFIRQRMTSVQILEQSSMLQMAPVQDYGRIPSQEVPAPSAVQASSSTVVYTQCKLFGDEHGV